MRNEEVYGRVRILNDDEYDSRLLRILLRIAVWSMALCLHLYGQCPLFTYTLFVNSI